MPTTVTVDASNPYAIPCADCGGRGPHDGPGHPYTFPSRFVAACGCELVNGVLVIVCLTDHPAPTPRCADCGEEGERTGHMGCQYPGRYR